MAAVKASIWLITFFAMKMVLLLICPARKKKEKSIVIVRLDAIGDYILFRNFLEVLKRSSRYDDYSITMIGNEVWKSLAEEIDNEIVDHFIWVDTEKFKAKFVYRWEKGLEICSNKYELLLCPVYSRDFFVNDAVVSLIRARKKIGSSGDNSNQGTIQKKIGNMFYDYLIPASSGIVFELYRNREFFERILNEKIFLTKQILILKNRKLKLKTVNAEKYAVLVIGAKDKFRQWPPHKFAKISETLRKKWGLAVVICGTRNDRKKAEVIEKKFSSHVINLCGYTTLNELCHIIQCSALTVSNETSAPHIAVGLNVPVVTISNGNHFGRFTPYPPEAGARYTAVYHSEIDRQRHRPDVLSSKYGFGSGLKISDIKTESVITAIDEILTGTFTLREDRSESGPGRT